MRKFVKWFQRQAGRGDRIGDVSRDVVNYAAYKRMNVNAVLKVRYGGLSRKALRSDRFMSMALGEFDRREKIGTLYSFKRGNPEENIEIARQLSAIALFHGVNMCKIPLEEEAPLEETSFEFFTLQGFRCYTTIKIRANLDPVLRSWFNIRDCDVKTLNEIEDSELLNHCDAMVEMPFVREDSLRILINEESLSWVYNLKLLEGLQGLFSGYADKFKDPDSGEGGPLCLKY